MPRVNRHFLPDHILHLTTGRTVSRVKMIF